MTNHIALVFDVRLVGFVYAKGTIFVFKVRDLMDADAFEECEPRNYNFGTYLRLSFKCIVLSIALG